MQQPSNQTQMFDDLKERCRQGDTAACQELSSMAMGALQQPQGFAIGGLAEATPRPIGDLSFMAPLEDGPDESIVESVSSQLDEAESVELYEAIGTYPVVQKAIEVTYDLSMEEGLVEGPGTETSDSIDAKLSDGEFVMTAKAVKQIGVDKLRKMMEKAEMDFDQAQQSQNTNQTELGLACGGFVQKRR